MIFNRLPCRHGRRLQPGLHLPLQSLYTHAANMTETPASIQRHSGPGSAMLVALTGGVASGKSAVSGILEELGVPVVDTDVIARQVDRKSTRLNSSHVAISYAVFCFK